MSRKIGRIIVRPLSQADFESWQRSHTSSNIPRQSQDLAENLTMFGFHRFLEMLKQESEARIKNEAFIFGAFLIETGEYIGQLQITDVKRDPYYSCHVTCHILKSYWSMNLAKELFGTAPEIVFEKFNLHRMESTMLTSDSKQIEIAESLNMRLEGTSRRRIYSDNSWRDMHIYAITADETKQSCRNNRSSIMQEAMLWQLRAKIARDLVSKK